MSLLKHVMYHLSLIKPVHSATRYKADLRMQALLFLLSVVSGTRIIYIVNTANWLIVIRQVSAHRPMSTYIPNLITGSPARYHLGVHDCPIEPSACHCCPWCCCWMGEIIWDENSVLNSERQL